MTDVCFLFPTNRPKHLMSFNLKPPWFLSLHRVPLCAWTVTKFVWNQKTLILCSDFFRKLFPNVVLQISASDRERCVWWLVDKEVLDKSCQHGSDLQRSVVRKTRRKMEFHPRRYGGSLQGALFVHLQTSLRWREGGGDHREQSERSGTDGDFPSWRCPQLSRRQNIFTPRCPNPAIPPSSHTEPSSPRCLHNPPSLGKHRQPETPRPPTHWFTFSYFNTDWFSVFHIIFSL